MFAEEPVSFPCEMNVPFSKIMFCCTLEYAAFVVASFGRGCSSLVFPMRCINSPSGLPTDQLAEQLVFGATRGFSWLNLYRDHHQEVLELVRGRVFRLWSS